MKVTSKDYIKLEAAVRVLNVAVDVSRDWLTWYAQVNEQPRRGQVGNRTGDIETLLTQLEQLASKHAYDEVRVICESTGAYHQSLLRLAAQRGMRTALASGEAVAKLRVVESNDWGKTDLKDPRAILTVALVGRLLIHRQLEEHYDQLRAWHRLLESAEGQLARAKTELHHELKMLFPDLDLSVAVLFGPTGGALVDRFGANPEGIVRMSFEAFAKTMRGQAKGAKTATLQAIYHQAQASAHQQVSSQVRHIHEQRVRQLREEIELFQRRKKTVAKQMVPLYQTLRSQEPRLPEARRGVISALNVARLVAEIGPLSDFPSVRELLRYAGLNLRERKSGYWKGQTKLSRRGRARLRKVLFLIVLPLVRRGELFGDYYHGKKEHDKMPGTKAMVCVMRKFLKMFHGWHRSAVEFDQRRVFQCHSAYQECAA